MLKTIRKHNKWLMVGFGVLLMVTWLVQPAINQFNSAVQNRTVAKLDGKAISARDMARAFGEVSMVRDLVPGAAQAWGIGDRDPVHWLLLTREAEDAGFVGGAADGKAWLDTLSILIARAQLENQLGQYAAQFMNNPQIFQPMVERVQKELPDIVARMGSQGTLHGDEPYVALARARGVYRMIEAYRAAGRVSDRAAMLKAREYLDAAKVDYVFVPAGRLIDSVENPDDAKLREHFDKYKTIKPADGEFGIGYLLPARVKIEWMKLDRAAIEATVTPDPIVVRQKYNQGKVKGTYKGDFATEQPLIEREMRAQVVDKAIQEAQVAVQTEILKATKTLDPEGKYKRLPEDWESRRPKFEAIAPIVVEAVKRATDLTIPLPTVTVKAADWQTREDLQALPDIGRSQLQAGGFQVPFADVAFWTKGLPGAEQGVIALQPGVPLAESFLTDKAGNRYYFTVLAVRDESAPDSVDESKDKLIKDWKTLQAYDKLKARVEELRGLAATGGLDAVIAAFPAATAPTNEPPTDPKYQALSPNKGVQVQTELAGNSDPIMGTKGVFTTVLEAAAKLNPLLPPEQVPADVATLSIAVPKRLGVVVVRIVSPDPVTIEEYRQAEMGIVRITQQRELYGETPDPSTDPFTFANLLKRHRYTSGDRDIRSIEDLKKDEESGQGS